MAIADALLPEYDHEMATTRKTLERVTDEKLGWKPHEKSGTMAWLASHLATLPGWVATTMQSDSLDINPPGGEPFKLRIAGSRAEALEWFDKNVAEGRTAIAAASDAQMMKPWSLLSGGQTLMTMPKAAVLRTWVMNHTIHHRAQLTVYLRLNDIPVPSIYGPSADEGQI